MYYPRLAGSSSITTPVRSSRTALRPSLTTMSLPETFSVRVRCRNLSPNSSATRRHSIRISSTTRHPSAAAAVRTLLDRYPLPSFGSGALSVDRVCVRPPHVSRHAQTSRIRTSTAATGWVSSKQRQHALQSLGLEVLAAKPLAKKPQRMQRPYLL